MADQSHLHKTRQVKVWLSQPRYEQLVEAARLEGERRLQLVEPTVLAGEFIAEGVDRILAAQPPQAGR